MSSSTLDPISGTSSSISSSSERRLLTPAEEYLRRISSMEDASEYLEEESYTSSFTKAAIEIQQPKPIDPQGEIIFHFTSSHEVSLNVETPSNPASKIAVEPLNTAAGAVTEVVGHVFEEIGGGVIDIAKEAPGDLWDLLAKDVAGLGVKTPDIELPLGFKPITPEEKQATKIQRQKRDFQRRGDFNAEVQSSQQRVRQEASFKEKVRLLGEYASHPLQVLKKLLGLNPNDEQELTPYEMVQARAKLDKQEEQADKVEEQKDTKEVNPAAANRFNQNLKHEQGPTSIFNAPG